MKTIETISDDPADWNIFSYVMEKHQRNAGANGKILNSDAAGRSHQVWCGTFSEKQGKMYGCNLLATE